MGSTFTSALLIALIGGMRQSEPSQQPPSTMPATQPGAQPAQMRWLLSRSVYHDGIDDEASYLSQVRARRERCAGGWSRARPRRSRKMRACRKRARHRASRRSDPVGSGLEIPVKRAGRAKLAPNAQIGGRFIPERVDVIMIIAEDTQVKSDQPPPRAGRASQDPKSGRADASY